MTTNAATSELLGRLDSIEQAPARAALHLCERLCRQRGLSLYLVGGAVRDLLLGRTQVDLDLAIEGEVAPVATALAQAADGRAVLHPRFGTARVAGPGFRLDLAQTRRDTYAHPGALPAVQPGASILDDLARRDFTFNALALRLTPARDLIDPFDGGADLRAGLVRVLHENSFRDDATRMLRGVRYGARLHYRFEALTAFWLQRDLEFLDAISGARLRRELALIFEEPAAAAAALAMARFGVLGRLQPRMDVGPDLARAWEQALAGRHFAPVDELGFCLTANPRRDADVASVSERLHLSGRIEKALQDLVRLRDLSAKLTESAGVPWRTVELLDGRAPASIWALSLLDARADPSCEAYLSDWRHVKPALRGDDLLALGVPAGERVGALLRRLRQARLRGETTSRDDEVAFVKQAITGEQG